MGKVRMMPRLVCAQAAGCSLIAKAWIEKERVTAWENSCTVASAISDPLKGYEEDGELTVRAINETEGCACMLSDSEILQAGHLLAGTEGLYAEPSSAAAAAALRELREKEMIGREYCCVCILTGHGLKDSGAYVPAEYALPVINSINDRLEQSID